MKCPTCGHEARDVAAFCGSCGASFATAVRCQACGRPNPAGQRFCEGCGEPLSAPATLSESDDTIVRGPISFAEGRHRVERFLGEGAYKRVYLARDSTLHRPVAVALIKTDALGADAVERLRREARAMGRLGSHPNLVTVYDAGEEGGRPYIVEEYIEGGTVDGLLKRDKGNPLPVDQALRIAAGVCAGLEHAHAHGIVHRDLKPHNVWLTAGGAAKLGDFGLGVALRESHSDTVAKLTAEGVMVGTVAYIPPEQVLGNPVTPRADLYSLGAMLYELVTGAPPFAGDGQLAIISQHVRTPPVAPRWHNPEVSPALSDLILALLAKDPRDRPPNAAAVRAALEALIGAPHGPNGATDARAANPLEGLAGGVFVGREREIDELCAAVDHAVSGRGQAVLIAGEPGVGKTRLAEQLTTYGQMRGAQVLWGRCFEGEGAPPYWPWTQVIRAYTAGHDRELVAAVMGAGAADIAQVVSEVRLHLPDLPEPPSLGPEQARFRMFESVTTFLTNASHQQALIVVIDDLHHADRSSLLLLEFLAHELRQARLLMIGTYRDAELDAGHPLTHTLTELARVSPPRRLQLGGLKRHQVARLIEMTAGVTPHPDLVAAIQEKSEGNPFFVAEMVRLLRTRGSLDRAAPDAAELTVPAEVRDVIERRLSPLSKPCRDALTVAALIGRDFHLRVLTEILPLSVERLLEALDEAAAARVITETSPGRFRFAHALVCDTLVGALARGARMRLHYGLATALERAYAPRLEPYLGWLAHHFLEAAPIGSVEKALHYAEAAAKKAGQRLAHAEAADLYQRALGVLELADADDERRCDLLICLGDAQEHAAWAEQARATFVQAAEIARSMPSPGRLARAALGFGGPRPNFGVVDRELVGLLEEALAALGDDDELRARLLARLAMELYFAGEQERRVTLSERAVAIAQRLGDPATLAHALNARHAILQGPANAEERLAIAREVIELAQRAGDRELACEGHNRCAVTLLEMGESAAAAREIQAHAQLAEELRSPYALWQAAAWRVTMTSLAASFAGAYAQAEEAFALGRRVRATDAEHCFAIQSLGALMELGRLDELVESIRQLAERYPATRWREGLTFIYSEMGLREEAFEAFEAVAVAGFATLPRDYQWLVSIAALADCCAFLGDARRAEELYELLVPYAGQTVIMPEGWICFGSVDRALGVLATTMEQWQSAEAHFVAALALDEKMRALGWHARTQHGFARMLLARRAEGDVERARILLGRALETAREHGMTVVAERVEGELGAAAR